jgi:hypothetical protein
MGRFCLVVSWTKRGTSPTLNYPRFPGLAKRVAESIQNNGCDVTLSRAIPLLIEPEFLLIERRGLRQQRIIQLKYSSIFDIGAPNGFAIVFGE